MAVRNIWKELIHARELLRAGEVVGMPTETVYGLAGSVASPRAIDAIFRLKERPFFDPLIVHLSDAAELPMIAEPPSALVSSLAEAFWPGPLTLVLRRRSDLNPMICAGLDTVAVRVPKHPFARRLIRASGSPVAAPSANKFGRTSPTEAAHVKAAWGDQTLYVLDGGPAEIGLESTVVVVEEGEDRAGLRILRPGFVTARALLDFARTSAQDLEIRRGSKDGGHRIMSPGSLKHHYMPDIPLVIIDATVAMDRLLQEHIQSKLIQNAATEVRREHQPSRKQAVELKLAKDPLVAARLLYGSLRSLSESGADFIYVRRAPEQSGEQWDAIWDRLDRAAVVDLSVTQNPSNLFRKI